MTQQSLRRELCQGRSFQLQPGQTTTIDSIVSSIISICSQPVQVLVDLGSTHSFVSYQFAKYLNKSLELLDFDLSIVVPSGVPLVSSGVFKTCEIDVNNKTLTIDLVPLVIQHFDVILGVD